MEKKGFFEDRPGAKSSTRLVFVFGSFATLIITGYMAYKGVSDPITIGTFLTMGVASFGGTKYFGTLNRNISKNEKSTQQE